MADALMGIEIPGYDLHREIGRGGMGVVYEATELSLRRKVALKVLSPHLLEDAAARGRFQREISAAVAIEHPHVVPVYAAGYENGLFFLAMRYVRGPDLWEIVHKDGRFPEQRAMRLVGQLASALFDVHEHGLVHRDVKPQNVLVWNAGSSDEHCFLTDFGLAKALDETSGITKIGALGTRGYMAPEVVNGGHATPACDQYALACLLFELLTEELPFPEDEDGLEDRTALKPLPYYAPGVSPRVVEAIERALSDDPLKRFADVRAFVMNNATAQDSFERSQAISETVSGARSESELVERLATNHGLSNEAVAEVADLAESRVELLRRRAAARRSLMGE
jgi:serine/threonine protein kinase